MSSRRRFLLACSATMVATGLPGGLMAASSQGAVLVASKSMPQKQQFAALVDETFLIRDDNWNVVGLRLVEMKDFSTSPEIEAFSLSFAGFGMPKMASGTYTVWHKETGDFSLFIHPRDEGVVICSYDADFCLLDPSTVKG